MVCMQQEMSAFHLCFDSSAAFLGRARSVMLIPSLVDSNHPFIERAHELAGSRTEEAKKKRKQSLTPLLGRRPLAEG